MRTISEVFTAGQIKRIQIYASYFRLMEISAGARATVRILKMGATRTEATNVDAGYSFKSPESFDAVEIECPTACTVVFAVSNGEGTYDRVTGEVSILGLTEVNVKRGATLAHAAPVTVGTIAVVALAAAANTKAVYFRADPANTVPICLGGSAVGPSNAVIRLNPGDMYVDEIMTDVAWYAYASAAAQTLQVMRGS
jgi:hypothetical protein